MPTEEQLEVIVNKKYSEIALQDKDTNMYAVFGVGGCSPQLYNIISDE